MGSLSAGRLARGRWSAARPLSTAASFSAGPMVQIRFPPAVSQANFRIAPLARPDLVERHPELLAHQLTAAGDIEASPHIILRSSCRGPRLLPCTRDTA